MSRRSPRKSTHRRYRERPSACSSSSPAAPSATTGGPVALPRAVRHPRLARRRGALQADGDRRRLGGGPAASDDGGLHGRVRPARQAAERRRRALSDAWCSPACCRGSCSPRILGEASNSLVGNANLIGKVYFPRLIIPAVVGGRGAGRFRASTSSCSSALMAWYGFVPGWQIVFLPLFVAARRAREPRARRC